MPPPDQKPRQRQVHDEMRELPAVIVSVRGDPESEDDDDEPSPNHSCRN